MKFLLRLGVVLYGAIVLPMGTTGCQSKQAEKSEESNANEGNFDLMDATGIWTAVSTVPDDDDQKLQAYALHILREKFKFFAGKDPARLKFEGTFTIDPRKSPKTFDASWEPEHGSISKGIYLLEGDHLTLCWGGPERPTEFPSKPGSGHLLIIFQRQKP